VKFLLDSSTCVAHLRGRTPSVTRRIAENAGEVAVCSLVVLELRAGARRSRDPAREQQRADWFLSNVPSLPFDDRAAERAAEIKGRLAAAGTPIGPYDLLIAAIAVANSLTLVTGNTAEFARVAGLKLEDWGEGLGG